MTFGHFTSWRADDRGYYTGVEYTPTEVGHFFGARRCPAWYIQAALKKRRQGVTGQAAHERRRQGVTEQAPPEQRMQGVTDQVVQE